ncbi:uncharacterized protein LOC111349645 [Spodoptera litura]|uniref:Uncharacterized protein LOC111349645 n=1 Tax=Spodoptera litura TaxID=69820 RepID=A0A9J7DTD5_SPOLT|nr:uncharacterized protein LOC111349645 [Spodoptera litura]
MEDTESNSSDADENPWPHLTEYVKFVSRSGQQILFACKRCLPKDTKIKVHLSSLNNLKQHVKRVHESQYVQFEEIVKAGSNRGKTKRRTHSDNDSTSSPNPVKRRIQQGRQLTVGESFGIAATGSGKNPPNTDILRKRKKVATPMQVVVKPTDYYTETERVTTTNNPEDEFDSFGKYIATALRSMPPEFAIIAKTEVQKTLSEIQLKILREMPAGGSIIHQKQHIQPPPGYEVSTISENNDQNAECTSPIPDSCYPCLIKIETLTDNKL